MRRNQGFTLVELLVALCIMSVLTAAVFLNINQLWLHQKEVRIGADLSLLESAAINYVCSGTFTVYGEIDQQQLIEKGYLHELVDSPCQGYHYVIVLQGQDQLPRVSLSSSRGIYERDGFWACNW